MKGKSLKEIAHYLGLSSQNSAKVSEFLIDSRLALQGALFFALPGKKVDGHLFLQEVAGKGAIGAVVSKKYEGPDFGLELLRVSDVKEALQQLGKFAFSMRNEKVVAVTGSMGKTTTKEFLATLLSSKYRVAKTPGNHNTQLTFPLAVLNLEGEYDVLVLEMGMNQKGEIAKLVEIAPPDIAVVTRIAPAGMEDFRGGLKAIAEAKAEIFSHPKTRLGIISIQAAKFPEILYDGNSKKWIYGWRGDFTDPRLGDFVMDAKGNALVIGDSPPVQVYLEGDHLKENFLAAVTAGRALGLSWDDIAKKAVELKPYERRFEKIEKGGITFIRDCYNANPDSVCAALKNLPKPSGKGKVIGVLGTMPDLGTASEHYHKHVGTFASKYLDRVLCIGKWTENLADEFSSSGKPAAHFSDLGSIKKELYSLIEPGDVVLIKGGNTLKLWELLD